MVADTSCLFPMANVRSRFPLFSLRTPHNLLSNGSVQLSLTLLFLPLLLHLLVDRYGAGGNSSSFTAMSARKLEDATDVGTLAKVDKSLSKAIMQARTAKKWSQKDLATRINAKPQIVAEYESGKAIPNPQIISKLERALGTKLPRGGSKSKAPTRASTGGVGMNKTATVTRGGPAKRR